MSTEATSRVVEVAVQSANLATFVELQARRICSVRGVAAQWQALALIAADLRKVSDELKSLASSAEMSDGGMGALDPMVAP